MVQKWLALLSDPTILITVLKGNHEVELIQYIQDGHHEIWTSQFGLATLVDFGKYNVDLQTLLPDLEKLPPKYETSLFLVTHAGVPDTAGPFNETNLDGVLWTRKPLIHRSHLDF